MQYKNIFFDLDDTLWAFSFNARDTFEEMYRKYEYDRYFRSFEHFYELYERRNIELWAEYADGKVTKEELNIWHLNIIFISFPMDFRNCNATKCVLPELTITSRK